MGLFGEWVQKVAGWPVCLRGAPGGSGCPPAKEQDRSGHGWPVHRVEGNDLRVFRYPGCGHQRSGGIDQTMPPAGTIPAGSTQDETDGIIFLPMHSQPPNVQALVDHLFRHEAGRMVAILTRIFGIHNLELAEGCAAGYPAPGPEGLESWGCP